MGLQDRDYYREHHKKLNSASTSTKASTRQGLQPAEPSTPAAPEEPNKAAWTVLVCAPAALFAIAYNHFAN